MCTTRRELDVVLWQYITWLCKDLVTQTCKEDGCPRSLVLALYSAEAAFLLPTLLTDWPWFHISRGINTFPKEIDNL